MSQLSLLAVRGLAGGALVVLFAVAGELLRPKSFGGIFATAPSVALASLVVTALAKSETAVWASALGMVVGAVALVAACVVGIDAVKRFGALRGAAASLLVWLVAATGLYAMALR
ncbi:MAG: DUF3147 family protein [Chloroflexi bacterium]|nr:MAG: DUF3147 family protein [Chloroflexota bacterium]